MAPRLQRLPLSSITRASRPLLECVQTIEKLEFFARDQMVRDVTDADRATDVILWFDSTHHVLACLGGMSCADLRVRVQRKRHSYLRVFTKARMPRRIEEIFAAVRAWHVRCCFAATQARTNANHMQRRNEVNMARRPIRKALLSAVITATVCLLAVLGTRTSAVGQSTGKHDFEELCAPCHGIDGTGKGRDLTEANPPDLTDLSTRNGGKYPSEKVYRTVDGRGMTDSHKRFGMPFWGIYLQKQGLFTPESDAAVKQRITEIVRYVETLQKNRNAHR